MEILFALLNISVTPFWLLMIFLPNWPGTKKLLASPFFILPFALVYAGLVGPKLPELVELLADPTAAHLAVLISTPWMATIAWVHIIGFDLFVGRWMYLDARERNTSAWIMGPILFLTAALAPCGFLAYGALRLVQGRASSASAA